MARYEEDCKRGIVQDHLAGLGGARALASKYGIDRGTVRKWIDSYRQHGEARLRRKKSGNDYSAQFKLLALKRMWREELTYRQAAALFDLRGGTAVIATWERQYHEGAPKRLSPSTKAAPRRCPRPSLQDHPSHRLHWLKNPGQRCYCIRIRDGTIRRRPIDASRRPKGASKACHARATAWTTPPWRASLRR